MTSPSNKKRVVTDDDIQVLDAHIAYAKAQADRAGNVVAEFDRATAEFAEVLGEIQQSAAGVELARTAMLDAGQYAGLPSVASADQLPAGRPVGELRTVRDEYAIYRATASAWELDTPLQPPLRMLPYQLLGGELITRTALPQARAVFIADDAHSANWDWMRALFNAASVPCAVAVISSYIGQQPNWMTWAQLRTLQDVDGWEMMGHTNTHPHLVTDGLTEQQQDDQLRLSYETCWRNGVRVESHVSPYGDQNAQVRRLIRQYYRSAWRTSNTPYAVTSINPPTRPIDQFQITRFSFDGATLQQCKDAADAALAQGALICYTIHPHYAEYTTGGGATQRRQDLADLLAYLAGIGLPVVNPRDALNLHGNVLDLGDRDSQSLRVSRAGVVGGSALGTTPVLLTYPTGLTAASPVTAFPAGRVSYAQFITANNAGMPTAAGALITDRTAGAETGTFAQMQFQTWRDYYTGAVSTRYWDQAAATWTAWGSGGGGASVTTIAAVNARDGMGLPSAFPVGVELCPVQTASAASLPTATGGVLTTVKLLTSTSASPGNGAYVKQFYDVAGSARRFFRSGTNADGWTAWVELTGAGTTAAPTAIVDATKTSATLPADFVAGAVTYSHVPNVAAAQGGYPTTNGGVLVTVRMHATSTSWMTQEYWEINSARIWRRAIQTNGTSWTAWVDLTPASTSATTAIVDNAKTSSTLPADFAAGAITYSHIPTATAAGGGYPSTSGGTLVTMRMHATSTTYMTQEYREINTGRVWYRAIAGNGTGWVAWVLNPVVVGAPATATSTGKPGQMAWDTNYIYTCSATNTWVRAPLSTW